MHPWENNETGQRANLRQHSRSEMQSLDTYVKYFSDGHEILLQIIKDERADSVVEALAPIRERVCIAGDSTLLASTSTVSWIEARAVRAVGAKEVSAQREQSGGVCQLLRTHATMKSPGVLLPLRHCGGSELMRAGQMGRRWRGEVRVDDVE